MHPEVEKYGEPDIYQAVMDEHLTQGQALEAKHHEAGVYMMAMGFKRRALFKMGWNEVDYISKLRTGTGRHLSYWKIALRMKEEANKVCPERASRIPTTPIEEDTIYER